jgi:hypothetical protein
MAAEVAIRPVSAPTPIVAAAPGIWPLSALATKDSTARRRPPRSSSQAWAVTSTLLMPLPKPTSRRRVWLPSSTPSTWPSSSSTGPCRPAGRPDTDSAGRPAARSASTSAVVTAAETWRAAWTCRSPGGSAEKAWVSRPRSPESSCTSPGWMAKPWTR